MLSQEEKNNIISEFPNIKLSYETIIHKKVYPLKNEYSLLAIPEGKKCFAWFTTHNEKPTCFLLELEENTKTNKIKSVRIISVCFSNEVSYGTILYGTFFYHLNHAFFSVEDIFLCKGNYVPNRKIECICRLFKSDIKQIAYNSKFVVFGLPVIAKSYEEFDNMMASIKYKIICVKYVHNYGRTNYVMYLNEYNKRLVETIVNKPINKNRENRVLTCKPDIQNDIYHLYDGDNYVGLAGVPDYNTSKMLNKLFRTIKENDDLDALELSDDEDEFENVNLDKFVFLDKSYKMSCIFNYKFKKWVPIKQVIR